MIHLNDYEAYNTCQVSDSKAQQWFIYNTLYYLSIVLAMLPIPNVSQTVHIYMSRLLSLHMAKQIFGAGFGLRWCFLLVRASQLLQSTGL